MFYELLQNSHCIIDVHIFRNPESRFILRIEDSSYYFRLIVLVYQFSFFTVFFCL